MKIAVLPPRIECSASLVALTIAAGVKEEVCLMHCAAEPRAAPNWDKAPWGIDVELFDAGMSFADAMARVTDYAGANLVVDPGAASYGGILELQSLVDVICIPLRPCPSEEIAGLSLWSDLDREWRQSPRERGVPVLLPVDRIPGDEGDGDWRIAGTIRQSYETLLGQASRLLPPTLPPLPRAIREAIYAEAPQPLDAVIALAGQRLFEGLQIFLEAPDVDWPILGEVWHDLDRRVPLPLFAGDRHARLGQDLTDYSLDGGPSEADLAAAPLLDDWITTWAPEAALVGLVTEHPRLGSGRTVATSQIASLDPGGKWARTVSRLYRLGEPRRNTPTDTQH